MPWPLCTSVLSMPSTSIWFERKPVPFTEFAVTPRMGVKDWLCTCDCAGTTPVVRLSNEAKFRPFRGRSRTDWPVRRLPMVVVSVSVHDSALIQRQLDAGEGALEARLL